MKNVDDTNTMEVEKITPMFARNATERYNVGTHRARRLNKFCSGF